MENQVLSKDALAKLPMFVSSLNFHKDSGSFYLKVKDAVATNAFFSTTAKATGTIWLSVRGTADMMPELEKQLAKVYGTETLVGTEIPKAHAVWGENVPVNESTGQVLTGVYDVVVK